jgi:hypothetical protein
MTGVYFLEYRLPSNETTMKKWNAIGILIVLVSGMVLLSGCTDTGATGMAPMATPTLQIANETVPVPPALIPAISPALTPSTRDPIIGSWLNGMVFYANGTVGSDGNISWKVNRNMNYSYFVISDLPSPGANNQRNVTSAEWIYNPFSDKIYRRGSSETFSREIPASNLTSGPPFTTIQTPITTEPTVNTPVTTTTIIPASKTPVATTTAVPTTRTPVATTTAVPISETPVATTTTLPTTRTTVATITAAPLAVEGGTGSLLIHTGGLGNDVTVFIAREGTYVLPINDLYDSRGKVMESQTSGYIQVKILPDGNSEIVSLSPGNYIAYLPGKNGGVPEQQSFTMNADCNTVISFSGYSYRASSGGGCGG